jgi:rod shape determining protein RodA
VLLLLTAGLVVVGLLLVYSATHQTLAQDGLDPFARVKKQAVTAVIGVVLVLVIATFDYRFFKVYAGFLYAGTLLALVLVKIPGIGATDTAGVAQRYFSLAGFQITPSEFAKLGVIVMLAAVLSELKGPEPTFSDLIRLLGLAGIPLLLVFIQPDIGTSIVIVSITVGMLIVAGTRAKHLAVLSLAGLVLIVGALQMNVIKQYQLDRITAFLDRQGVSADARYNLDQSLIAVGSGAARPTSTTCRNSTQTSSSPWWGRSSASSARCSCCCCSRCCSGARSGSRTCRRTRSAPSSRPASPRCSRYRCS